MKIRPTPILDRMLSRDEQDRVVAAIQRAEAACSGEIRVHIEPRCTGGDPWARATLLFEKLGMTATRERNGVLIYVAPDDRRFCILGDRGIHGRAGEETWERAAQALVTGFRRGSYGDGIVAAIEAVGTELARHFPPRADDIDELSDAISTEEPPTK